MSGSTATQRIAPVDSTSVMGPPTATTQRFPGAPPEPPRSRTWAWVLLVLGVLAVFALALWLGRSFFGDNVQQVRVPQIVGQPEETARTLLTDADLVPGTPTQEASDTVAAGLIISSDPAPGEDADVGSTVNYVVSSGAEAIAIPAEIVGRPEAEARQILQTAGLQAAPRSQQERSDQPAGTVIGSDPEPGTELARGSAVTLIVSQGEVAVPNVQGLSQADAETQLTDAGFNVVVQTQPNSASAGTVIAQDPGPNTQAQPGTNVTITVSSGPPPPTTAPPSPSPSPSETARLAVAASRSQDPGARGRWFLGARRVPTEPVDVWGEAELAHVDDGGEAVGARHRVLVAHALEPVGEQPVTALGQHRFGVELHALER